VRQYRGEAAEDLEVLLALGADGASSQNKRSPFILSCKLKVRLSFLKLGISASAVQTYFQLSEDMHVGFSVPSFSLDHNPQYIYIMRTAYVD